MVELTQELAEFIWDKCRLYCISANIPMPEVLLTFDEVAKIEGFKKAQRILDHCLGNSWSIEDNPDQKQDIIFINVDATDYLWQILDTISHEIIHIKYPNLRHGKKFQYKVNELIMKN